MSKSLKEIFGAEPIPKEQAEKLGAGALQAFIRQGAKELAQVIPAFPESVRVVEEPGTVGNPTQQIVTQQMKDAPEIDMDR